MLADGTTTLWQAVSPKTADAILRDNGRVLHPSCQGDAFALLKLNPELARQMAEGTEAWCSSDGANHARVIGTGVLPHGVGGL